MSDNSLEIRLKSIIPSGMSQSDFADEIGVGVSTFKAWLGGSSSPKADVLARIAAFTGVDLNWLITGESLPRLSGDENFVLIKRFMVLGSAGAGAVNTTEEEGDPIAFRRDWLKRHVGVSPNHLSVIQLRGDSMEPTIKDGSLLLVNHNVERLQNDGIYAFLMDGDLHIKRIQKSFDGGLIIKSDNPNYDDQIIKKPSDTDFQIVGPVKWAANSY